MSKITMAINQPNGRFDLDFFEKIKLEVESFFIAKLEMEKLEEDAVQLLWYDDTPVSSGVAVTIIFNNIVIVDISALLQVSLRQKGYIISISLGY